MQSASATAGPPETKPKRGLVRLTFKARSKNNQAPNASQLNHRASVHRKTSMARRDSRRQSRLVAGRRNSKRVSSAQKRMSAGSRVSGRSHSPASPAAAGAPPSYLNSLPAPAQQPARSNTKSGGGLFRRITRHFTSKKTSAAPPPVPVPALPAAKLAPHPPLVPAIVQPASSNPQSRAVFRSPSPVPGAQLPRSKSPAPSTASKNSEARSPRLPSPDRVSFASWRYPALPTSPSPVPPSPSLASPAPPPFGPSLTSPLQALIPAPPSPGLPPSPSPLQAVFPRSASPAPLPEPSVPSSTTDDPEPHAVSSDVKETTEQEASNKPEAPTTVLGSPLELEVPFTFPPIPALVQSDTESSAGHQSLLLLTPTSPVATDEPSQISRGRRPRRKDTPLLMVPGGDSDATPSFVEDDEDAWTDDEGVSIAPTRSKENLPLIEEAVEVPRMCSTPERKPLTVFVPPAGGLTVTVDVTSSPTELAMIGTPTIVEPSNHEDDVDGTDEFPENPRWSQAPKTGGIEFFLPAQPEEDAPLKTSRSERSMLRSQTLDPNAGVGGLKPQPMRRSTTFNRIFNFGSKKDVPTLSPTIAESDRRPSTDRASKRVSILRPSSRLEIEAKRLPTRAPTVYTMSNAELLDELENLRTKRTSMAPGTHTPTVVDDETARVTELAYF